jgi:DNA-directed RNA polymerase subunit RPC12/RpoP
MAIKLVTAMCPNCGAKLEVSADRKECFCTYCGTKVLVDDGSYTVTHRTIDDAKVIKAKAEADATRRRFGITSLAIRVGIFVVVAIIAVELVMGLIGASRGDKNAWLPLILTIMYGLIAGGFGAMLFMAKKRKTATEDLGADQAILPISTLHVSNLRVEDLVAQLKQAGFTNVGTVARGDVNRFNSKKEGYACEMKVNGESASAGDVFRKDAHVVITYHSRK